jgi:hypothetical protein
VPKVVTPPVFIDREIVGERCEGGSPDTPKSLPGECFGVVAVGGTIHLVSLPDRPHRSLRPREADPGGPDDDKPDTT